MKRLQIFRPGKHTAMSGETLSFTEEQLQACASAYDPTVHEAPITIGHPTQTAPAYGWVGGLAFRDGHLEADPKQIDPAFEEHVKAGRFKKLSASFYLPDSPSNPKPGTHYLRHLAFLGAQPPALKGLRDVSFAASETGVVEFADWSGMTIARLLRGVRELILSKFGQEAADAALPTWDLDGLTAEAARETGLGGMNSSFAESPREQSTMTTQTQQQLDQRAAEIERREQAVTTREASFGERETRITSAERAARRAQHVAFADSLVKDGKLPPAQKDGLVAFMATLDASGVVEFGEGTSAVKKPALEWLQGFLTGLPKVVDFTERGNRGTDGLDLQNAQALATAAQDFQESERKNGRTVSIAQAMQHVTAGRQQ